MVCIALIPARGGSKEIPKKNIKNFCGKPLIYWSIKTALENKNIDRVIVSTDSEEIADIARGFSAEVPFIRPSALAKDDTPGIETIFHALEEIPSIKDVLLMQPTSPLRRNEDINEIFKIRKKYNAESAISLNSCTKHPNLIYKLQDTKLIKPLIENSEILNRQEMKTYYTINGALYLSTKKIILEKKSLVHNETIGYVMPQKYSVDIDSQLDWEFAELLMMRGKFN
jgi:CMP-N-acetylneuraminic acid synthetase